MYLLNPPDTMAYINLPTQLPGIRGLMAFRPTIAAPLNGLAEALLRTDEGISKGERELIGTLVSALNGCVFCQSVHGAVAQYYFKNQPDLIAQVKADYHTAPIPDKLKALLEIAEKVQQGGKHVTEQHIQAARVHGASDLEIHDTVLIAAAFCMFNRYVDGLGTFTPTDSAFFQERGRKIAEETGYAGSDPHQ
ncbi:MAG: peroxidase-related enzyme [Bacteroidia bacterium]|nr:peroxidase-related enzyme [Bacteroidia bacterium]